MKVKLLLLLFKSLMISGIALSQSNNSTYFTYAKVTSDNTSFITRIHEFTLNSSSTKELENKLQIFELNNHKRFIKYIINNYKIKFSDNIPHTIIIEKDGRLLEEKHANFMHLSGSHLVEITDFEFNFHDNKKPTSITRE